MSNLLKISSVILLAAISGCATGVMQLSSIPDGSSVQLIGSRGEIKNLGKTPLNIPMSALFGNGSNFANLRIEKSGFFTQGFIIPETSLPTHHNISIALEEKPNLIAPELPKPLPPVPLIPVAVEMDKCTQFSKPSLTKLSKGVAVVQSFILKRDFEIARVRLAGLISEFNYISVLYDLQGNIFYLQKNYADALTAYENSLELEPENMETAFIVKKLRIQLGQAR